MKDSIENKPSCHQLMLFHPTRHIWVKATPIQIEIRDVLAMSRGYRLESDPQCRATMFWVSDYDNKKVPREYHGMHRWPDDIEREVYNAEKSEMKVAPKTKEIAGQMFIDGAEPIKVKRKAVKDMG